VAFFSLAHLIQKQFIYLDLRKQRLGKGKLSHHKIELVALQDACFAPLATVTGTMKTGVAAQCFKFVFSILLVLAAQEM